MCVFKVIIQVVTCRSVYVFVYVYVTCIEKAPDNGEVRTSPLNCVSSV